MVRRTTIAFTAALALAATPLPGCQEEGPAEKAGKQMDEAVSNLKDEVDEAAEKLTE